VFVCFFLNEAEFSMFSIINLVYLKIQFFFEIEIKMILTSFDNPLIRLTFLLPKDPFQVSSLLITHTIT